MSCPFCPPRVDARLNPQGYNLGWNCGAVAGQTVFHAHLHVIPRFAAEPHAARASATG
ncbi:MAG: HIT family protein [Gemmatimonadaceae bacterium]|nr:HIT family protein [Gemmatimonadaceae bacterium]